MSPNRPCFSPADSDDLLTLSQVILFILLKSIFVDTYAEANRVQKLQEAISSLGGRIKINTLPLPLLNFFQMLITVPLLRICLNIEILKILFKKI